MFLIDENASLVSTLQLWLDNVADKLETPGDSHLPTLFINGLAKVCKPFTEAKVAEASGYGLIAYILDMSFHRQGNRTR